MVLSIDPGETTGWVLAEVSQSGGIKIVDGGHVQHQEFYTLLTNMLDTYPKLDTIVYEEFRIFGTHNKVLTGDEVITAQLVSVIKQAVKAKAIHTQITPQKPADRKFGLARKSDANWKEIKKIGKCNDHTFDAYQHLCLYHKRLLKAQGGKV